MNIGIIGCGGIAVSHLNAVRHNNCEVTALCDVSEEICRSFAEKNNLLNVRIFTSIDELCAGLVCEAVIICSTPAFHEKAACTALKNGLHVMCEKPLAHTPASARIIEKAVKNSGI